MHFSDTPFFDPVEKELVNTHYERFLPLSRITSIEGIRPAERELWLFPKCGATSRPTC
jgi:hypothetical protein